MRKFLTTNLLPQYIYAKNKIRELLDQTQSRILIYYFLITSIALLASIPVFSFLVIRQVDQRIEEDLTEEIEVFRTYLDSQLESPKVPPIYRIFNDYLKLKSPSDKTILITIIEDTFYRSSPLKIPDFITQNPQFVSQNLARVTEYATKKYIFKEPEDILVYYQVEPVILNGEKLGVLVALTTPNEERGEVIIAIKTVVGVLVLAWLLSLLILWRMTALILQPIRNLIQTAQQISKLHFKSRMDVQGNGEIAQLASTFNLMMDRIETAFHSQSQLINDISHELRTPITIIRGNLELINYANPREGTETINLVLDELDRMTILLEDLLLLAKAEQNDFLRLEKFDLNSFIQDFYQKIQVLGNRKWQLVDPNTTILVLDRQRITQALTNLVQNALNHTDSSDTITIIAKIVGNKVYLGVQDTGIGIPKSEQQKIFERFFRASNSHSHTQSGGLGLSIVKAIVTKHDGYIQLHSKLGKGSLFYLVLPVVKKIPTNRS